MADVRTKVEQLQELLEGASPSAIQQIGIEALRIWRRERPNQHQFTINEDGFGRRFLRLLAEHRGIPLAPPPGPIDLSDVDRPTALAEVMIAPEVQQLKWMGPVHDFTCWLQAAGYVESMVLGSTNRAHPVRFRLTAAGLEFVAQPGDHPLLPGFVARVETRCVGLPDTVPVLLADAYACLERSLMRASIVMLGVAFELAIEAIIHQLAPKVPEIAATVEKQAAQRISALREHAKATLPTGTSVEKDDRFAVLAALEFCDQLRRRRNDASHTKPRYGFADRSEAEELLVSGGRHLPVLWRLYGQPPCP